MHHLRLLGGLAAGYVVLDRAAALTGSMRGQAGLLVGALTVATIAHGRAAAVSQAPRGCAHQPRVWLGRWAGVRWSVCAVLPWAAFAVPARKAR